MGFFRGRNTTIRTDKISAFSVNTAEYGAAVMEVLGTTRISGNVIYWDDFTAHEHRETQRSGKGGKSTTTTITYTYSVAVILGLCEGPITGINRVWKGKDLYYYPDENIGLTLHKGTANQQPWSYVTGKHPDKALSYSGLAYMAGVIDLGDSASMPSYNFEVKGQLLNTGDGTDVNPMDYILYVLRKSGQANATFKGADSFRAYCANADLLISTPADATDPQEAQKIVNEIAQLCGAYVFHSNDTYKIVPLADRPVGGWQPDNTIKYDLTTEDFLPEGGSCVTWSRKDSSEQYNRFTVEYENRENGYEKESVTYEDVADIAERGVKQAPTIQAGYVYTKARAVKIAEEAARRNKVGKNQYNFKLDWPYCRLEPGDKVRITDVNSGITNQVVMITDVKEDEKGLPVFTAISWFDGNYGPAEFDVHEVDRPFVDFNKPPSATAVPAILQPPADLTAEGLEVWIAAKGAGDNWGGCTVYVSDNDEYYRTLGKISNNARLGPLTAVLSANATSLEVDINGTMLSGSAQDAKRANTLLWISGECMSYQTATLLANGHYKLEGLVRGQYNTTPTTHGVGSVVVRCDETLLRCPFSKEDIGKKLYFKFCSYNIFGSGEQSLAEVPAYEYTLQPYYIPPVRQLTARNRYRQLKDGVTRYDIVAEWDPPDLQSFYEARVWYKTNNVQTKYIKVRQGIPASELGFAGEWIYGGSGKTSAVIPQAVVGDRYRIAVTTVDQWGVETSPDASPMVEILVALRTETPNTPDGFTINFTDQAVASWREVVNSDIAFYEVRKDDAPGEENANLLARVTGLKASLPLTERTGTLYLYAYSAAGKYSAPATLEYNKTVPPRPAAPHLTAKLGGFALEAAAIPAGCDGMNIYIDGAELVQVHTVNNVYTHACDAGIYDVTVAYTDLFGEGAESPDSRVTVKATVDAALLEEQAIKRKHLDTAMQKAVDDATESALDLVSVHNDISTIQQGITETNTSINLVKAALNKAPDGTGFLSISQLKTSIDGIRSQVADIVDNGQSVQQSMINQNASDISAIVQELNNTGQSSSYAGLLMMKNGIASKVTQDDVSSWFQQDHSGFYIKGSLINIDGTTKIGNNIITKNMIQTGAVTADKLSVSSLSAISAVIGVLRTATSGARLEVRSNQILVYDSNRLRVRMGVW